MMAQICLRFKRKYPELLESKLYNEQTFYRVFMQDLANCEQEIIIESPFLTKRRVNIFLPKLRHAAERGVNVVVNTRHPMEHEGNMRDEAAVGIARLQDAGVRVLLTGGHHRKLAVIDRKILYEGSLNILSQSDSCEIMRRITSERLSQEMIRFVKLDCYIV